MGETVELTDVVLRIIGAFYAFGGFVATRAGLDVATHRSGHRRHRAEEADAHRDGAERLADRHRGAGADRRRAAARRVAARRLGVRRSRASGRSAYIYYVAPRFFDRGRRPTAVAAAPPPTPSSSMWRQRRSSSGPPIADGSSRSTRHRRRRSSPSAPGCCSMPATWRAPCGGRRARPRRSGGAVLGAMPTMSPACRRTKSKRIKVMADYHCDPLWALDEDRYGCFPPEMIWPIARADRRPRRLGG